MDAHRKHIIHSSGQSCWRTPVELAAKLTLLFGCRIDLAATAEDKVCSHHLGPGAMFNGMEDSLIQSWMDAAYQLGVPPVGFLNPPFSLSEIKALKAERKLRVENGMAPYAREILDRKIAALRVEEWARKAFNEAEAGFTTIGVFPYSPQTEWFRYYVMGHTQNGNGWRGHAALDMWRLPHRVSFLTPDGKKSANAGVNTAIIHWGPNPGYVGPWVPSARYWSFR